ncbi:MAG: acetate--CoA ligase [Haliscomenobacter sp.]|nr:acetate--CoA ligase [Haliscomenobacter sp.]
MRRQLEKIFNPKSIAVIGASNKPDTVGNALISNLLNGGFAGKVYPVNLRHDQILGLQAYSRIDKVPEKVDLAVIAIPAFSVPDVVEECGKAGVGGLVIISAGFLEVGQEGKMHADKILEICRRYGMRLIGPNCLGFIRPVGKINASFAAEMAFPGNLALISQSGALLTSILDWSVAQRVGFSYFVSIGSMIDVDFADLIDYFGTDPQTSCILIYMESLVHARRFMSAARSFSRNKPIIVLKAGRSFEGAQAALSHTGSMAGNDEVYDAAFRRAGIIRVDTIAQLFNIAQALALQNRPRGNRLAIITNAGGPGVLATDYLIRNGGQLARLSPKSLDELNQLLPSTWSRGNPIDLLGDASPDKYRKALQICIHDPGVDAALLILTPQYMTDPKGCAQAVAEAAKGSPKPVLASWMGEDEVQEGRQIFESGRIPNYRFPESAVDAFLRIWRYTRDLQLLYETPPAIPKDFSPDTDSAKQVVADLLSRDRQLLTEIEAKKLLSAYQIPVIKSHFCQNPKEAIDAAEMLGYPVVLKIVSPDISHKTDVGGVMLDLQNLADVQRAYYTLYERVALRRPAARLEGVLVEPMIRKPFELLLGAKKDPVFGPVIAFGHGGTGAEVFKDFQLGLPPLNMALAQQIVEGTRFFRFCAATAGCQGST